MTSSDDEAPEQSTTIAPSQPLWQLLFFLLMWQALYRVSNAALNTLLRFMALFLHLLSRVFASDNLRRFAERIPKNISGTRKLLWNTNRDGFVTYVVCPKCESVYDYNDCIASCRGYKESKRCRHIAYPNHPHSRRRQECGTKLLKKVKSGRGYQLIPVKEFAYQPLQRAFSCLVRREGFLDACEQWRGRMSSIPPSYLGDVYDGRVWQTFATNRFLQAPHNYLLTLNVDWFQPFTHIQYSVGAIYLTIQNLPRSERYKEENVILVGIIPGPSEPSLTINSYLGPLVQELKQAWDTGILIKSPSDSQVAICIRLALTCVSCDIPATRKVCGFLGHNATLGCNKCYKKFIGSGLGNVDYSGYEPNTWLLRNCSLHRQQCKEILAQTTKTGIKKKESEYGIRYSVLLTLEYFDPIDYTAIDIMHNLFLGTGKHMFQVWLKVGVITVNDLHEIDRRASAFRVPYSIGRLPINIASNYGGFKAAQWQTWITVYSPIVLKGLIPASHFQCWLLFVRACTILCQRIVKEEDVVAADALLLSFCKRFEQLYGSENCTPNIHLHLHLKDCFLNHGPAHGFWLYSFERYNGLLGSFHTNKKSIEQQVMRKFINTQHLRSEAAMGNMEFLSLLPVPSKQTTSSLTSVSFDEIDTLRILNFSSSPLNSIQSFGNSDSALLLPPYHEGILPAEKVKLLKLLYTQLYQSKVVSRVSPFYIRSGRASLCNQVIGSMMNAASCNSSSVIMAYWPSGGNDLSNIDYSRMHVGEVQYFCKHKVIFSDSDTIEHILAYVCWKQKHPHQEWYGISATVCFNMNEPPSMCSFIPIQRVHSVCGYCVLDVDIHGLKEHVFIAVPVPLKFSL